MALPTALPRDANGVPLVASGWDPIGHLQTVRQTPPGIADTNNPSVLYAPDYISNLGGVQATYVYAISATAPYATPTDWIVIKGSATKVVRILRVEISGAATAATDVIAYLQKHTVANTSGTKTNPTPMQHDSNDAPASATVVLYSVAPTIDASATTWKTVRMNLALAPAATTVVPDRFVYNYAAEPYEPLTLRGVAQELALNFNSVAVPSGGVYDVAISWSESNT